MSELLATLESFEDLLEAIPDTKRRLEALYTYLQASERLLIDLIDAAVANRKHVAPSAEAEGDLEFGLVLYWLQHPDQVHLDVMLGEPALAMATQALVHFAPPSAITEETFSAFSGLAYDFGFVAADGTLYTPGKYAQLDPLWLTAAANYAINLLDPDSIHQPFPDSPYHATVGGGNQNISIAIIGDWGTGVYDAPYDGQGPAVAIMDAVRKLRPDYVVHLGDVYYCGTDDRLPEHEERDNFLRLWRTGTGARTCFTLNSNHEMYGGAQGLIGVALANGTPFQHQNGTTYFGLEFGNWIILGLDSAYFDPSMLYMKGSLGNPLQQDFIRTLGELAGKKIFVMTHHNPMTFDGSALVRNPASGTTLWNEVYTALGNRNPDVWYWGHLHLGVVYNDNSAVGAQKTLGRCVGHSAIPFGDASGMNADNVDYYAHTSLGVDTRQVQNGFAVVTFGTDGSLEETFHEIDANGRCLQAWPPA